MDVNNVVVPVVIQGDTGYFLLIWLTKPFTGHLDRRKELLNSVMNSCRITMECAFGILKGR